MQVDLSLLMQTTTQRLVKELKALVKSKKGLDGARYSDLKEPVRPAGRGKSTRLNRTGKFQANAFVGQSDDTHLTIQASDNSYDGSVSFADIVRYNNRGSADVNVGISDPPLIFPNTDQEVMLLQAARGFEDDLRKTLEVQLGIELQDLAGETHIVIG